MEEGMELPVADSPYTLELTNTFSLDLVVQGYMLKEQNGRNSYVKGKTIKWNVNSEDFTMDVLMDGLSAEMKSKKKTPVKKTAASQEKAKTPVKIAMSQEKAKKKTPPKKATSKGKKSKKNVPFAPVIPPPPPPVVQPPYGAKRSLFHWLGG